MITDRDRRIIRHLEQYKYATLEQLEKIFFREQKNSYNIARRRMARIVDAGYAKVARHAEINNRLVYMWNSAKVKMPDKHRIIVLDVLANIHDCGFNVKEFIIEKQWMGGKIRSDAFTVFTMENVKRRCHYFVEVALANHSPNIEKYDRLLETNEVFKYLGRNTVPRVLLISDRKHNDLNLKHTSVVQLNTKMDSFATIILPP